jgi:hypothetical protein
LQRAIISVTCISEGMHDFTLHRTGNSGRIPLSR